MVSRHHRSKFHRAARFRENTADNTGAPRRLRSSPSMASARHQPGVWAFDVLDERFEQCTLKRPSGGPATLVRHRPSTPDPGFNAGASSSFSTSTDGPTTSSKPTSPISGTSKVPPSTRSACTTTGAASAHASYSVSSRTCRNTTNSGARDKASPFLSRFSTQSCRAKPRSRRDST